MSRAVVDGHAARLLGRHVRGRADHRAGRGLEADVLVVAVEQLRDAEVEQLDELGAVGRRHDDHVVGLEIAVDDADRVRGAEAVADLHEHGERARQVDRRCAPTCRGSAPRRNSMMMNVVPSSSSTKSVTSTMLRWRTRLTVCASWKNRSDRVAAPRVVAAQELERDLAAELHVLGAIHVAHAALAEQLGQPIAAERAPSAVVGIVAIRRGTGGGFVPDRVRGGGGVLLRAGRRFDLRASVDVRSCPTASDGCESRSRRSISIDKRLRGLTRASSGLGPVG